MLERFLGTPRQARELPSPLDMLIATVLSQNTNDKNSHRAYVNLRKRFTSWDEVAAAPLKSIVAAIRPGGMANQKGPRIKEILRQLKLSSGGYRMRGIDRRESSAIMEELTSLPGVGVKTAACVLLFSLGRDVFPVDTHVHRLCTRLGLAPGSRTPEQTFERMRAIVPRGKGYSLHTNMIRFGRKICRTSNPRCGLCPLYPECVFRGKRRNRGPAVRAASTADHNFMLLDNV